MSQKKSAGLALLISPLVIVGLVVVGMRLHPLIPTFDGTPLFFILLGAFLLLCFVNRLSAKAFVDSHFGMPPEEQERLMDDHRAKSSADPDAVLKQLGDIPFLPMTLIVLYTLLTAGMAVSLGMATSVGPFRPIVALPLAALLLGPIQTRLALLQGKLHLEELMPESAMPVTHELARRAARVAGVKGAVRLQVVYDRDISISRIRGTYVVFLGSRLLTVATEEELYAGILRQFVFFSDPRINRRINLHYRLSNMGSAKPRRVSWFFDLFYSPADAHMEWYAALYNTALTRKLARDAAALLQAEGCARADASLTVKQEMWEYFDFEWFTHLPGSVYESPMEPVNYEATICTAFRNAMERRWDVWLPRVLAKLPQENFIGVTPAENRALLGLTVADLPTRAVFADPSTPFGGEDARIHQAPAPERYAEARRVYYTEPMEVITAWEASDRDRPTYEISPVLDAYRTLHRSSDLEALCDRILSDEPDFAHALFLKGYCLLTRHEVEGIDFIYRAIDINKNYMREGFDRVSQYCRLMGLADEMETFRRRSRHVVEAHAAEHDDACSLRVTDRLVKETGLDAELPAMLDYMVKVSEGTVERIYLVRKVISEDFFTSAFVIYITPGADRAAVDRAYNAIFHYLDAQEWQYSLFLYNRETEMALKKVPDALVWEKKDD